MSLALLSHNTRVLAAVWCPSHVRCLCFWGTRKLEVRRPMSCGKAFILCSCTVCSQSPTRGIRRGIRGGSGGDPGQKRGIHVIQVVQKPMKTGGSTACSSAYYNIKKRNRGGAAAEKAARFLEFYLPCGSVLGLWSRLGFLGGGFWPLTSSK